MQLLPQREEIDHRTIKLLVGVIALTLAGLTSYFAGGVITSISASYHVGGWAQTIFVGFLFAIGALMLAYNGLSTREMVLSKVAAIAAFGVALFPCKCDNRDEVLPYVHAASATILFLILAYFCYIFFSRARQKARDQGNAPANARATIYMLCGITIIASILAIAADAQLGGALTAKVARLIFYAERAALMAFGISWLTASRVLPLLTLPDERFSPLSDRIAK
jgi:predicted transporter